jgi:hypothetical protein
MIRFAALSAAACSFLRASARVMVPFHRSHLRCIRRVFARLYGEPPRVLARPHRPQLASGEGHSQRIPLPRTSGHEHPESS